jgi:hypothetical protein
MFLSLNMSTRVKIFTQKIPSFKAQLNTQSYPLQQNQQRAMHAQACLATTITQPAAHRQHTTLTTVKHSADILPLTAEPTTVGSKPMRHGAYLPGMPYQHTHANIPTYQHTHHSAQAQLPYLPAKGIGVQCAARVQTKAALFALATSLPPDCSH